VQYLRGGGNAAGRSSAAEEACRNFDRESAPTAAFEPSLFVWATVMSRPAEDRAIVDAGLKALAFDSGPPLVCDEPAATYERASDEHGRLAVSAATNRLGLGDKIRLTSGHCISVQSCHCPFQAAEVPLPAIIRALIVGLVFWPEARLLHAYQNTALGRGQRPGDDGFQSPRRFFT
jgi:D-serine deaminase-like pyridoxal phosphate-dependent protein